LNAPRKTFWDYPSYKRLRVFRLRKLLKIYHSLKRG